MVRPKHLSGRGDGVRAPRLTEARRTTSAGSSSASLDLGQRLSQ